MNYPNNVCLAFSYTNLDVSDLLICLILTLCFYFLYLFKVDFSNISCYSVHGLKKRHYEELCNFWKWTFTLNKSSLSFKSNVRQVISLWSPKLGNLSPKVRKYNSLHNIIYSPAVYTMVAICGSRDLHLHLKQTCQRNRQISLPKYKRRMKNSWKPEQCNSSLVITKH